MLHYSAITLSVAMLTVSDLVDGLHVLQLEVQADIGHVVGMAGGKLEPIQ